MQRSSQFTTEPRPPLATGRLPSDDFLNHLQERLGLDELAATQRLQHWLSTYEPGPTALARATQGPEHDLGAAA